MANWEKTTDDGLEYLADTAIGTKAGTRGHKLLLDSSRSCRVNVLQEGRHPQPVFRLDRAHGGHPGAAVPHVNINPRVNTRLRADPHLPIPFGEAGLQTGYNAAKCCKAANKVLIPLAVAVDVYEGGKAIYHDVDRGTTRNTVETGAAIAGGWGGGFAGGAAGAAAGTAVFPGIGTLAGGIVGGIAGGIGGSIGARSAAEAIGDQFEYNIADGERPCKKCGRKYKCRKYVRKDNGYCDNCNGT